MRWPAALTKPVAAGLLLAAAEFHLLAAYEPEHLETALFFGFSSTVTIAQATLATSLMRFPRISAPLAVVVNVFLVLLWAATRVVPLPGEEIAESVEWLGLATKAVEVASLPFLLAASRSPGVTMAPRAPAEAA